MSNAGLYLYNSMELHSFLLEKFKMPTSVVEDLVDAGKRKTYQKKELFLRPFTTSSTIFFIEQGMARMFYDKDGRSITHSFVMENQFIGRSDVFLKNRKQKNTMYGLMAVENETVVHELPFSKIEACAQSSLQMNNLIRDILLHHLRNFSNRLSNLQFEDAQMRYEQLLEEQPEIILRAPLGDIASYLGISPQTLSVIRSRIR